MRIRHHRLHRGRQPELEIIEAQADGAGERPPLFLLHGAFAGAWCWTEPFLQRLTEGGRRAYAVSLRGHGGSGGRADLHRATLDDFLDDARAAMASLLEAPIVVAHSLGGYLAQLLIGRVPMRGLVLLNSLPPDGLALVASDLALSEPSLWIEGVLGTSVGPKPAAMANVRRLFGDSVPAGEQRGYVERMVPESPLALLQAHVPRYVQPAMFTGIPVLVLHGDHDRLIGAGAAARTAVYHGAARATVAQAGHFMMLGSSAAGVAESIDRWIGSNLC